MEVIMYAAFKGKIWFTSLGVYQERVGAQAVVAVGVAAKQSAESLTQGVPTDSGVFAPSLSSAEIPQKPKKVASSGLARPS